MEEVVEKVNQAINMLLNNERDVLIRGLGERVISNHLAGYLKLLFNNYDVDSEYDGDIDKPNDRKALNIAGNRIAKIGRKVNEQNTYRLIPDIIIHIRGTNTSNLVVIEVKKDTSPEKDKEYDLIKLEHLTIDYLGNHYNYTLGIAIVFGTKGAVGLVNKIFFKNGLSILEQDLM